MIRSHVDILSGAIALTVVINTILYRAINTLNMLLASSHFAHNYDRSLYLISEFLSVAFAAKS